VDEDLVAFFAAREPTPDRPDVIGDADSFQCRFLW